MVIRDTPTTYEMYQENGQRKYGGPPRGWIGPPPPKGTEAYVKNLPRDCFEQEIIPLFEPFGEIYCVRIMMDFSGTNRGYCFVQYATSQQAEHAIKALNGYRIRPGYYLKVVKSVDNCRLFIGHIPKYIYSKDYIDATIRKYTLGVKEIILYLSSSDKRMNKGFCIVEYEDHRSAAMARRQLLANGLPEWDAKIVIDWAVPERFVNPEIMKKVTIMCIRNLMLKKTIQEALERLVPSHEIARVRNDERFWVRSLHVNRDCREGY